MFHKPYALEIHNLECVLVYVSIIAATFPFVNTFFKNFSKKFHAATGDISLHRR